MDKRSSKYKYNLLIIPEGAVVPEEVATPVVKGDIIEKLTAATDGEVIAEVSVPELELLTRFNAPLKIGLRAIIGLHGPLYSTLWASFTQSLPRITIDNLLDEEKSASDASAAAGQHHLTSPELRQRAFHQFTIPTDASEEDTGEIDGE